MNTIFDIKIEITPDEILAAQKRKNAPPQIIQDETERAIEVAYALATPKLLYAWAEITILEPKHVTLKLIGSNLGKRLYLGPNANQLAHAHHVLIEVHTIGRYLENRVTELNQNGKLLQAYLLDCAGVVALSKVNTAAHQLVEKAAKEKEWGVGASIGPGSLTGWSLNCQYELCSLLELDQIDLQLSNSHLLIPVKSASSMVGIGPNYKGKKVGSICHLCSLRETCWRRKK